LPVFLSFPPFPAVFSLFPVGWAQYILDEWKNVWRLRWDRKVRLLSRSTGENKTEKPKS
jgi:hypothetical protein